MHVLKKLSRGSKATQYYFIMDPTQALKNSLFHVYTGEFVPARRRTFHASVRFSKTSMNLFLVSRYEGKRSLAMVVWSD